ncbi:MAG: ComEC/Rec2 family competence protein [Ginsengibacter sp.]
MARAYKIYIWKKAPFLRLLLPLIAGIILELYCNFHIRAIVVLFSTLISAYVSFRILPLSYRYKLRLFQGIIVTLFMINAGLFLTWQKDIRNHATWYGNYSDSASCIIATISEPPIEKNKSYKAIAAVGAIIKKDSVYGAKGNVLIYFAKDSSLSSPGYGDKIIIKKGLTEIKNSGNPAEFNYQRYCAFRQIFHQCYLKKNDWVLLKDRNVSYYQLIIFKTREFIVNVLNKYINGNDESSLAEAMLIGYKVDLDKDLVQAYSNAGVIHLIVIAGLHLGLIYILLLWITGKIPFIKNSKIIRLIFILFSLWFFSLLTGASPPVLRAVVMFSFIATGKTFNKNTSIFNSLASSAFVLLCYDPFTLWDAGFQLSYLAVTGIVISQRYIYNWLYFNNKILNEAWKIGSVSLSAQLFTLPACLYYFHQVPLLFLLSNIIAIPLAMCILYGCILLVIISPLHFVALYLGKALTASIWLLNHVILFINALPFSLWNGFSTTVAETILLYIVIIIFLYWLIKKEKLAFKLGICSALLFSAIVTLKKWSFSNQKKIIVYNVPDHKAIDFIDGNAYNFIGDSDLVIDGLLQNFNLKPGRISFLLTTGEDKEATLYRHNNFYQFHDKRILIIDSAIAYLPLAEKIYVDYIIISKNPKIFIPVLAKVFNCHTYVFDGSNSLWKIDKWKKDCEELHLRFHSVPGQGAFITDL